METVVAAIIVGAFSGLLGSIAGPQITHRLDRRRREEERQEDRNRELRRMVETVMRLGRSANSTTLEIHFTDTMGGNVEQVIETSRQYVYDIQAMHPEFAWRPQRIHDETLRQLAIGLNLAVGQLYMLVAVRRGVILPTGSMRAWPEQAQNVRCWVDKLMEAVDGRMDELGW